MCDGAAVGWVGLGWCGVGWGWGGRVGEAGCSCDNKSPCDTSEGRQKDRSSGSRESVGPVAVIVGTY